MYLSIYQSIFLYFYLSKYLSIYVLMYLYLFKYIYLGSAHQCIHLENISPSAISVSEMTNISLQISALPDLPASDHYLCLYNGKTSTRALKVPGGLICPAPSLAARPPIPPGSDHVTMNLAVTLRSTVKEFVSTQIMIFNCDARSTCLECVSSLWPCAWCVYGNKCSNMASGVDNCKEAIVSSDTSVFQLLQVTINALHPLQI